MKKKQKNGAGEQGYYEPLSGQNYYDGQQGDQGYYGNEQNYYGNTQNGYGEGQGYYNGGQGGQQYYGDPQGGYGQGYYNGGQGGYGQGYYNGGQGGQQYYGDPQGGYNGGQQYYGDPQGGYNGGQQYYGDPQGGYNGGQQYYGDPQGGYYNGQQDSGRGGRGKKNKKKKKNRKLIFAIEVIVLLIMAAGLFAMAQLSRMDRIKLSDIIVNSGLTKSGYRNIAIFGVDSREGQLESGTNSDTIMVASINEKTGDIKLVSVYRDTYLDHTNGTYGKATECYAGGGAERSVNMLNKNLDLDITDFVTVDFSAIIEVVDLLGGIDLDLTEEEVYWLNGYLVETSQVTGVDYTTISSAGTHHVSGIQAMAYCRIRYTEGWDFKRTERQRIVLNKIFDAAKSQGVTGLISIINAMLPNVSTSLSNTELIALAADIAKYNIVDSTGFPYNQQSANISAGDCVVPVNLANNVSQLHEALFGEVGYTPSSTVQEISNKIINDTGIQ